MERGRRSGRIGVSVVVAQRAHGRVGAGHAAESPAPETLAARLAAVVSFYRWQEAVFGVPVASRLLRGAPRRTQGRGLPTSSASSRNQGREIADLRLPLPCGWRGLTRPHGC